MVKRLHQLSPRGGSHQPSDAERALVASVLLASLQDLAASGHADDPDAQSQRDHAWRWLNRRSTAPFSFCWCCKVLGLDADATRTLATQRPDKIRAWIKRAPF